MKKLMITAVFALGSLTATMAQETASVEAKTVETLSATTQEYVAVDVKQLPQPVLEAVKADFADASIAKAWKNSKNEYKLELNTADKKVLTVNANSKGEWIKKG